MTVPRSQPAALFAAAGALCYALWGCFHVYVAWQIYALARTLTGIAQGRMLQLSAYLATLSVFVIVIAVLLNWRNDRRGYWLNLAIVGWADGIWVLVVVAPGYVGLLRGLLPPAVFVMAALLTTAARRLQPRLLLPDTP
jgi:MFS family permease